MMKKAIFLLLFWITAIVSVVAQANYEQAFRFEKEFGGMGRSFSIVPNFINGTDNFWFKHRDSISMNYYIVYPKQKQKKLIFDNQEIVNKIKSLVDVELNPNKLNFGYLEFDKQLKTVYFYVGENRLAYNLKSKELKIVPDEYEYCEQFSAWDYSPDSLYILFVQDYNLFLLKNPEKSQDSVIIQLTSDGSEFNSYARYFKGMEESETRPNGSWLSDSRHYIIQSEDRRDLDFMYLTDYLHWKLPAVRPYCYAVPGDSCACQYGLKLVDIVDRKVKILNVDKWKDQYVECLHASKDGKKIYFQRIKRSWDEKEICVYDLETDSVKVLIHEEDKPFFDYVMAQIFFLNDGKEILYRSERTGKGHFYLYDGETGALKRAVTSGDYIAGHIQKIDDKNRDIYFYAYGVIPGMDPYYKLLCKTNLDRDGFKVLTPDNGTHKIELSPSNHYVVDNFSRVDTVPRSVLRDKNGRLIFDLVKHDIQPYLAKGWQMPVRFKVKAADSITDLYGVMWKPMNFDSTRKYPIISEVYPGPQSEYVPVSFKLNSSYATKLAQLGFIVIQVGHRGGTPVRGKAYQRYCHGNMRDYPLADDRAAIVNLAKQYSFIDTTRVGIYGHSGGGFMSAAALLTYPDFYSVAVSMSGNHDNRIYSLNWVELINGVKEVETKRRLDDGTIVRETRFKAGEINTTMQLVENCKGHLLLVQGMLDDNVHPAHTMRLVQKLIDEGKNFDMIFLPKIGHGIDGDEGVFVERKMWNYFAKYLLDDFSGEKWVDINE